MKRFTIGTLAAAIIFVSGLSAETVNQRRENQQDRVAQGVKSGQMTARETSHVERQEARVNHQVRDDREDHNGHLTSREHAQVNREQNKMSREIYRDKHNSAKQ